jgi:hypothetical protein
MPNRVIVILTYCFMLRPSAVVTRQREVKHVSVDTLVAMQREVKHVSVDTLDPSVQSKGSWSDYSGYSALACHNAIVRDL